MKKIIKETKKIMAQNHQLETYKKVFTNHKMQFLVSKIWIIFAKAEASELAKIEMQLAKDPMPATFAKLFSTINNVNKWTNFGHFMYFIFKTSAYKNDKKNNNTNPFLDDPIKANATKRLHFTKWLKSLDFTKIETNLQVKKVLKLVF